MLVKIGISKSQAKEYGVLISGDCDGSENYYLTFCKKGRLRIAMLVEVESYFSNLIKYTDGIGSLNDFIGTGKELEFCAIIDGSQRAKVLTISKKAQSIIGKSCQDILQFQNLVNDIPWKFLGFQSPLQIKGSRT